MINFITARMRIWRANRSKIQTMMRDGFRKAGCAMLWRKHVRLIILLSTLIILCCGIATAHAGEKPALIAAASGLRFAMGELVETFERDTGRRVSVSFGSSGNIARQIRQGAPYEVFLSADERSIADVAKVVEIVSDGALYAIGRLALFAPKGSPLAIDANMDGLRRGVREGIIKRFTIANPDHAPYGRAAREALVRGGLWEKIQPMLVLGENVSQAARFAASGPVEGGLLAYSLVKSPAYEKRGRHVLIPPEHHAPIRHRMAVLKQAGKSARAFYVFMTSPAARTILARHGFSLPRQE